MLAALLDCRVGLLLCEVAPLLSTSITNHFLSAIRRAPQHSKVSVSKKYLCVYVSEGRSGGS